MSAQVVGEKKRLQAERKTGLSIDRLLRLSNHRWEARVLTADGHEHVAIDPATWETWPSRAHWTSCKAL